MPFIGQIWKIWTENAEESRAGGLYLFADETSALAYLRKHQERLLGFGIPEVRALVFAVNAPLSLATRAPLAGLTGEGELQAAAADQAG